MAVDRLLGGGHVMGSDDFAFYGEKLVELADAIEKKDILRLRDLQEHLYIVRDISEEIQAPRHRDALSKPADTLFKFFHMATRGWNPEITDEEVLAANNLATAWPTNMGRRGERRENRDRGRGQTSSSSSPSQSWDPRADEAAIGDDCPKSRR